MDKSKIKELLIQLKIIIEEMESEWDPFDLDVFYEDSKYSIEVMKDDVLNNDELSMSDLKENILEIESRIKNLHEVINTNYLLITELINELKNSMKKKEVKKPLDIASVIPNLFFFNNRKSYYELTKNLLDAKISIKGYKRKICEMAENDLKDAEFVISKIKNNNINLEQEFKFIQLMYFNLQDSYSNRKRYQSFEIIFNEILSTCYDSILPDKEFFEKIQNLYRDLKKLDNDFDQDN